MLKFQYLSVVGTIIHQLQVAWHAHITKQQIASNSNVLRLALLPLHYILESIGFFEVECNWLGGIWFSS